MKYVLTLLFGLACLIYLNGLITQDIYVNADGMVYQIDDKKITPRSETEEDFISGNIIRDN